MEFGNVFRRVMDEMKLMTNKTCREVSSFFRTAEKWQATYSHQVTKNAKYLA